MSVGPGITTRWTWYRDMGTVAKEIDNILTGSSRTARFTGVPNTVALTIDWLWQP